MGKLALLFALATTMTVSFANMSREESAINRTLVTSDYQDEVVSRETAQSAYNIVVSQVKADFENYRGSAFDETYKAAWFEYTAVSGASDDEVIVTAKGMLNNHEYEITGVVKRLESRILDAITIDGDFKESKRKGFEVEIGNQALISGHDTNPDGSPGNSGSVFGLLITTDQAYSVLKKGTGSSTIIGKSPKKNKSEKKSIEIGVPKKNLTDVAKTIEAYDGPDLLEFSGNQQWDENTVIGSSAAPKVVRVEGNVELKDNAVGYGILYVHGDFKMKDNARWYGIVYQYDDGGKFEIDGNSKIYGAIIVRSIKGDPSSGGDGIPDRGLIGGHFDVDVFDHTGVNVDPLKNPATDELYHEHQYDDKYDVTGVNLMLAGCKKPGLCWNDIMGTYAGNEVDIEFFNSNFASGTYLITANGVNYAGSARKNPKLRLDPSKITTFSTNFTDLCELKPTQPKMVQGDAKRRDGSFSIQIFGVDAKGKRTAMLYELAVYHHWKPEDGKCDSNPDPVDPNAEAPPVAGKGMTFKVTGNSSINYSSAILKQMNVLVPEFDVEAGGFSDTRYLETALRVGRVLSLRNRYKLSKEEYLLQESYYMDELKGTTIDLRSTTTTTTSLK